MFCLLTSSCVTHKETLSIKSSLFSSDNLVIERDSNRITYSLKAFIEEQKVCENQENYGEIMSNTEIDLTPESKAKIAKDGGVVKVLEMNLSKDNFDKLTGYTSFKIGVVLDQDATPYGNCFSIFNRNMKNVVLSDSEITNLYNYATSLKFLYIKKSSGNFKLAAFYSLPLRK